MKRLFQFALLVILLGGIALAPALSQEQNKRGPHFPQKKTEKQEMGGMMDDSMMSNQNEMMAKMLDTMKEMAQMMKDQAKDPDAKAKADQIDSYRSNEIPASDDDGNDVGPWRVKMKSSFYPRLTDLDVGDHYETDRSYKRDGPFDGLDETG